MIVTGKAYLPENYPSMHLPVYIENHTDKTIVIRFSGSSTVNGYEVFPGLYLNKVSRGKKMFAYLNWGIDELQKKGIETIKNVTLDTRVIDDNAGWDERIAEGTISFELYN